MKDKEKQIEEMAEEIFNNCAWRFGKPNDYKEIFNDIAEDLTKLNYRKLPKDSVVIPKEISCYENIEKGIRTFRLDGNYVDFTQEQIMALAQIFHFKEKQENEIRKETAEKILFKFESAFAYYDNEDMFSKKAIFECLEEIVKSCVIEIKE